MVNIFIEIHHKRVAAVASAWLTTHFLQLWRRWRRISDRSASGEA